MNMDVSKTSKLSIGHDVGQGKNIISNLSDDIRHRIISFLPIKDIVKTSILSKRWRYLSTFISSIEFDDESLDFWTKDQNLDLGDNFLDSVDRGLILDDVSCLRKLRLYMNIGVSSLRVNSWGEQTTQRFFSGCPVLEELVLYNCGWKNIRSINLYTPTLRALTIYYDPSSPGDLLNCEIKIYAVNLKSIRCTSYLISELVLCGLSSLVDAYIEVETWGDMQQEAAHRALKKLLAGIHSVKSLALSNVTLECLSFVENLQHHLPTYHSLTHLEVKWDYSDYTKSALVHFLQKSPNLESLDIPEGFDPETFFIEKERILKFVPHCFRSCLKTFSISHFEGIAAEMHLLEYLVENAIVLERLTIPCLESLSQDSAKQEKISHQLQLLRTGLTSCVIEFL